MRAVASTEPLSATITSQDPRNVWAASEASWAAIQRSALRAGMMTLTSTRARW
jgi:hypothetical protein